MQNQPRVQDNKMLGHSEHHYAWSPVVIGGLIGLGLGFLMDLLSVSMGLSLFTTDPSGARALAMGGMLGMLIGTVLTMYATGFAAGYLSGPSCRSKNLGMLYGFAAWCLSLVLMISLAAAVGNFMAHYGSANYSRMQMRTSDVTLTSLESARTMSDKVNPTVTDQTTPRERNVKATGMQSFAIFLLFFLGALSAAYGGHCGYKCWIKHDKH